jgi:hypothetical protein
LRRFARLIATSVVAAASAASLTPGDAQAQTCFIMQGELMQLMSQGQGGVGDRARYERAYREQANVLARTERRARNAGCFGGGFFLFRREPSRECQTLIPKLRQMQQNLARLDQLRRRAGSNNAHRIRELQGMMRARGCDVPGGGTFSARRDTLWEDNSLYSSNGTYRTLCVRTCDGYYFPISFSTVPNQFPVDAETCQRMCPGAQSELYYHPNPGGGPETMVSVAGVPYSSLPTAFQYRTSFDASCSCRPPGGYSVATSQGPGEIESIPLADPTIAPLPRPRPAPGEDPETLANRAGDLTPRTTLEDDQSVATVSVTGADGRPVRVVGPVYWGAPEQQDVVITPIPN